MNAVPSQSRHFDDMFRVNADPWGTETRWYERRKRALLLAMLPGERYRRAFEPGCGAGALTAALALRCDELIATDASARAIARAGRRVGRQPAVTLAQACVPDEWPSGQFDLIVVSELAYYLQDDALGRFADACASSLNEQGVLVACHWRRGAYDMRHSACTVHTTLGHGLERASHYEDADMLLDVWSRCTRSVAQQEGLA